MKLDLAIREFETQLSANQRSPHTISSYIMHPGEFRTWLAEQRGASDVRHLDAATRCRFATARGVTHTAEDSKSQPEG
jgi:hypothetical protein